MTATHDGSAAHGLYHPTVPPADDTITLPSNADLTTINYEARGFDAGVKFCISYLAYQLLRENQVHFGPDLAACLRLLQLSGATTRDPNYQQAQRWFIAAWSFMRGYLAR